MTLLVKRLNKCSDSHRGGARALKPHLCNQDWCIKCGSPRTNLIIQAAKNKFGNCTDGLYSDTAVIGPTKDYQQAIDITIKLLRLMAEYKIDLVGSLEYCDPNQSFAKFNKRRPFFKTIHNGIGHLHFVTDRYHNKTDPLLRLDLFPMPRQLVQMLQGQKERYKDQTTEQFIEKTILYGRKRDRIKNRDWFQSIKDTDQQLSFMIDCGVVYIWDFATNLFKELDVRSEKISEENVVKLSSSSWISRSESLDLINHRSEDRLFKLGSVVYTSNTEINEDEISDKLVDTSINIKGKD